jgi:hypothetical protein
MEKDIKIIFIIMISLLYLSSAFNKITNFTKVATGLKNKLNSSILFNWIPFDISYIALTFALILLLVGPCLLLYGVYNDINKYIKYGIIILLVFLVLATIIYHPITDTKERWDMLKNLSLIGSFGFIYTLIN